MSRRHVAATNRFVCTGEFLWKSLQQNFVPATSCTNSVWFDFLRLVRATKLCCGDKIFIKILKYTRSDLSLRYVTPPCCCNGLPDLYTWSDLSPRLVVSTCHLVCSDLKMEHWCREGGKMSPLSISSLSVELLSWDIDVKYCCFTLNLYLLLLI